MTKTSVIYHSADFDGLFCREIAKKFLPDAELIGWDYNDAKIPFPSEGTVYVLDLSPECFGPLVLSAHTWDRMIWIDHHKTAIDKFHAEIPGYRIDGVSACRLAWQWFKREDYYHGDMRNSPKRELPNKQAFINREVNEPLAVRLVGEYDIWDKRDYRAELLQYGLRSLDLEECGAWPALLSIGEGAEGYVGLLLDKGKAIQYAKTQENAAIIKRQGFDVEWEGLKFLACNHAMFNSHLFTAGIKSEHDALFGFRFDGKHWHASLYHAPGKEHHDLSKIAVKYGGGGHKGACGFKVDKLPFIP